MSLKVKWIQRLTLLLRAVNGSNGHFKQLVKNIAGGEFSMMSLSITIPKLNMNTSSLWGKKSLFNVNIITQPEQTWKPTNWRPWWWRRRIGEYRWFEHTVVNQPDEWIRYSVSSEAVVGVLLPIEFKKKKQVIQQWVLHPVECKISEASFWLLVRWSETKTGNWGRVAAVPFEGVEIATVAPFQNGDLFQKQKPFIRCQLF